MHNIANTAESSFLCDNSNCEKADIQETDMTGAFALKASSLYCLVKPAVIINKKYILQ